MVCWADSVKGKNLLKEAKMKKRVFSIMGLSFLLAAFALAAVPAQAQNVDEKIKVLEQELMQLKSEQIELRKDATAAAAALPSFEYTPGNGLSIQAADKSWGIRFTSEMHLRMLFESGLDEKGRTNGEIMGRRFRPGFIYCINNCLWEMEATLDLDGFGTGNGKNAFNTAGGSILQRGAVVFHGENISPWLPAVQFGMEVQNAQGGSLARQGSGSTGAQAEYDLHTRNNGFNTGRAGQGIVFNWDNKDLSGIGIPGRLGRFQFSMASIAEGDDGLSSFTDRKDFNVYFSIQPMSQVKNKWVSGLTFEYGAWFCNNDARGDQASGTTSTVVGTTFVTGRNERSPGAENGCSRYRIQDHGDGGRQTLFDSGADSIGRGLHVAHGPGLVWAVGPYTLRAMGHFQTSADQGGTPGKKKADSFLIGHDLYLWSPKGFLTGSSATPGSVLAGTHFERVNLSCGDHTNNNPLGRNCEGGHFAQFHRDRILLREWDLWYFVAPRMSVGASILWYDASNLRNGLHNAANNLGICSRTRIENGNCRAGIGGDWTDVQLNWRYTF
jgi:hypothetical protein